jgi:hypothetical protein
LRISASTNTYKSSLALLGCMSYFNLISAHSFQTRTAQMVLCVQYHFSTSSGCTAIRACSYDPLTGTSRLPRRIFPCVHMEYFVPLAEMKLHCSSTISICKTSTFQSNIQQNFYISVIYKKKYCFRCIFNICLQNKHKTK